MSSTKATVMIRHGNQIIFGAHVLCVAMNQILWQVEVMQWKIDQGVNFVAVIPRIGGSLQVDHQYFWQTPQVKFFRRWLMTFTLWTIPVVVFGQFLCFCVQTEAVIQTDHVLFLYQLIVQAGMLCKLLLIQLLLKQPTLIKKIWFNNYINWFLAIKSFAKLLSKISDDWKSLIRLWGRINVLGVGGKQSLPV